MRGRDSRSATGLFDYAVRRLRLRHGVVGHEAGLVVGLAQQHRDVVVALVNTPVAPSAVLPPSSFLLEAGAGQLRGDVIDGVDARHLDRDVPGLVIAAAQRQAADDRRP